VQFKSSLFCGNEVLSLKHIDFATSLPITM
jgi:hypothetical protein